MKVSRMKIGEKKKLNGYQSGSLVARGSFTGIKEGNEFAIEVVGSYNTVVFGRVNQFMLTYPVGSDVRERNCSGYRAYKFTLPSGETEYFWVMIGDGRTLSELEVSSHDEWERFYEKWGGDC